MSTASTIKEYLVELGFHINMPSYRKFEDMLKLSEQKAEVLVGGLTKSFVIAGGAVATALAAVGAGTVALATHAANMDLEYQKFARRMFIGVDAARSMKIALDALGVSVEEMIWGPPELAERYRQLITDQRDMIRILGGDTGERALRKTRDIEFQFTRMGPEIQRFGIRLTEDVLNKLFGRPDSLENRLKEFNEWFKTNIPAISDKISNVLAPALRGVWDITKGIFNSTVGFVGSLGNFMEEYFGKNPLGPKQYSREWFMKHPGGYTLDQLAPSHESLMAAGPDHETTMMQFGRNHPRIDAWMRGLDYEQMTRDQAKKLGIDPDLALSILHKEDPQLNPYAVGKKGEIGLFQLMPKTIETLRAQGLLQDPYDPAQNIAGGLNWLLQKKGKGSWQDAVRGYNGSGPAAQAYEDQVWRDYMRRKTASEYAPGTPDVRGTFQRESYSGGPIHVYIQGSTGMSKEEVKIAVREGVEEVDRKKAQRAYTQRMGAFA